MMLSGQGQAEKGMGYTPARQSRGLQSLNVSMFPSLLYCMKSNSSRLHVNTLRNLHTRKLLAIH